MNVPVIGPNVQVIKGQMTQIQDEKRALANTVTQSLYDKRLVQEGDVDFSQLIKTLSMSHSNKDMPTFMDRNKYRGGPDDREFVWLDSLDTYLKL